MLRRHRILVQNALIYFDVAAVLLSYFWAFELVGYVFVNILEGTVPETVRVGHFFHVRVLVFSLFVTFSGYKLFGIYEYTYFESNKR